jgi:hypothetical protein
MSELKISSMERRTLNAVDSANPFQTPVRPHAVKGRVVQKKMPDPEIDPIKERADAGDDLIDEAIEDVQENVPQNVQENVPTFEDVKPVEESEFQNPISQSHDKNGMPSYRLEFSGRDIFVGLPWYKTSNPVTSMALVAMALDFGKDRIRFDLVMGDPGIHNARSSIVEKFLQTDAKWLLMLDDDIIPSIGRAEWFRSWIPSAVTVPTPALQRHVLHRLVGAGKTLVGAAYWGRQENGRLMCSDRSLENDARGFADRVVPIDWIGTGCLLAHRKVFEDVQKAYPELKSNDASIPFDYFLPMGKGMSEDVSFCTRAKKAGHQPHIDLGIPVKHLGYKTY